MFKEYVLRHSPMLKKGRALATLRQFSIREDDIQYYPANLE